MSISAGFMGGGGSPLFEGVALWNGVGWDQQINNQQGTLLASAARTTSTPSAIQTNYNARGLAMFLNITAAAGTGITAQLLMVDPVTGTGFVVPTKNATNITTTGEFIFLWYPGIFEVSALANRLMSASSQIVPRQWQASVSHSDASSLTYSLGYSYIV